MRSITEQVDEFIEGLFNGNIVTILQTGKPSVV